MRVPESPVRRVAAPDEKKEGPTKLNGFRLLGKARGAFPSPHPGGLNFAQQPPARVVEPLALRSHKRLGFERNGEGGIRTRDGVFTPYSLSRRVPSAARPPLPERTEGQFRACPSRPRERVGSGGLGRVAERLNAAVLKTVRRAIPVSGVRIPPLPLVDPQRRDGAVRSSTGRHAPRGSRATSQPRG